MAAFGGQERKTGLILDGYKEEGKALRSHPSAHCSADTLLLRPKCLVFYANFLLVAGGIIDTADSAGLNKS